MIKDKHNSDGRPTLCQDENKVNRFISFRVKMPREHGEEGEHVLMFSYAEHLNGARISYMGPGTTGGKYYLSEDDRRALIICLGGEPK